MLSLQYHIYTSFLLAGMVVYILIEFHIYHMKKCCLLYVFHFDPRGKDGISLSAFRYDIEIQIIL